MHIIGEKHIAQIDFAEYLRKSDLSKDNKVNYGQFLQNGNLERYCYISKSRSDVQDLERSSNQSFLVERWRLNWIIKVLAGVCLLISIHFMSLFY